MNTLPFPLFLTHNTKLEGIPRKIKWKIHAFLHFISSFQSASYKMIHLLVFYFLLFSISFYIQLFITSFSAIWKKISVTNFPFFEQIQPNLPPNLLKGKNQLSMAKVFFLSAIWMLHGQLRATVDFTGVNYCALLNLIRNSPEVFRTKVFCRIPISGVTSQICQSSPWTGHWTP